MAAYQTALQSLQQQLRPYTNYCNALFTPGTELVRNEFFEKETGVLSHSERLHAESVLKQIQQFIPSVNGITCPSSTLKPLDDMIRRSVGEVGKACSDALQEYGRRRDFYRNTLQNVTTSLDSLQHAISSAVQAPRTQLPENKTVSVAELVEEAGRDLDESLVSESDNSRSYVAASGRLKVGRTLYYGPKKKYKGMIIDFNESETEGADHGPYRSVRIQNERNGNVEIHDREVLVMEGNWFLGE
ncbi:MAG: hypothetical protein ACR2IE_02720 [Candidatus Sumerlaeaceae bacterium]